MEYRGPTETDDWFAAKWPPAKLQLGFDFLLVLPFELTVVPPRKRLNR